MPKEPPRGEDAYSQAEAQRRFEKLVRAALSTPPKPLKDIPRKRPKKQRKAKLPKADSRK